jgi:GEVED domain/Secretion system C-terminal sorting domain/Cleaved Adhesin Domain
MNKIILSAMLFAITSQTNAQFSENFDASLSIPTNWTVIDGGDSTFGSSGSFQVSSPVGGNQVHSAPNSVQISYTASAHDDYLVTPAINVTAGVSDRLTYWVKNQDAPYNEAYAVKLSTTTATASAFTTILTPTALAPNSWTKFSLDLTSFIGQTVYIGFHATSTNMFRLLFDDIVNDSMQTMVPTCVSNQISLPNISCGNFNTTLSWTAVSGASGYYLTIGTTTGGSNIINNFNTGNDTSYIVTNQNSNTTYYWKVVPFNAFGAATGCSELSYNTNPTTCYCNNITFVSLVEPITTVNFAGINNVTSPVVGATPSLEDFTSIIGNVTAGTTYPITLKGNSDGNFTNRYIVFIDWNQNKILNDSDEVYFSGTTDMNIVNSTGTDSLQAIGNILVPATAIAGNTRMRVKKIFGTTDFVNPCLGSDYGQVEDYTINVTALSTVSLDDLNFSVYPNPVKDILNLSYNKKISTVSVFNIIGQEIKSESINETNAKLDLSNLPKGNYFVKICTDNLIKTIKILKQ